MATVTFRGRSPDTGNAAFLASNAFVIGDAMLGEGCSIWFGAVLRADNDRISIGSRTNIQDNCVVHVDLGHPVTLGSDVSVGHGAVLHGCTIGNMVLVGMGAIVMNDAVIGDGSILGAGAVIASGTQIPPRSLVLGIPGRVRGAVTDDQVEGTRSNAVAYHDLAREFALGD